MIHTFRICCRRYTDDALSGEGARLYGGRWNARGTRVVYLAGSVALAQLEMLVHLDSVSLLQQRYEIIPVDIPDELVTSVSAEELPDEWESRESLKKTCLLGESWVRSKSSLALRVPSAVVPSEWNYLLNPAHPEVSQLMVGPKSALRFDDRLIRH